MTRLAAILEQRIAGEHAVDDEQTLEVLLDLRRFLLRSAGLRPRGRSSSALRASVASVSGSAASRSRRCRAASRIIGFGRLERVVPVAVAVRRERRCPGMTRLRITPERSLGMFPTVARSPASGPLESKNGTRSSSTPVSPDAIRY